MPEVGLLTQYLSYILKEVFCGLVVLARDF
jgi:hypothetical protein